MPKKCNSPCTKSRRVEDSDGHEEEKGGDDDHHLGLDRVARVVSLKLHQHLLPGADQPRGDFQITSETIKK